MHAERAYWQASRVLYGVSHFNAYGIRCMKNQNTCRGLCFGRCFRCCIFFCFNVMIQTFIMARFMVEQQQHDTWHKQLQITHFFRMLCFNSALLFCRAVRLFSPLFFRLFLYPNNNNITGKDAQSITVHFWRYISFSPMLERKPERKSERERETFSVSEATFTWQFSLLYN